MKILNTAIAGFGLSGSTFHAPLLSNLEGFHLKYFCSSNIKKVKNLFPQGEVFAEFSELCALRDLDLVIITSPNANHYEMAKKALLSGLHVIIDKPFVTSFAQGKELISIAQKKELFLSVFHNRRWDNAFLTFQKCRQENLLKDIHLYESYFDRYRPIVNKNKWKEQELEGSGLLYDLGSHLIDQVLVTLGMPTEIFADLQIQRENAKVADYFNIILKYDRARAIIGASNLTVTPRPMLSVQGIDSHFVKYGLDPQEQALGLIAKGEKLNMETWGTEPANNSSQLTVIKQEKHQTLNIATVPGHYFSYYQQVYQAIVNGKFNPVPATEALQVIYLIELALESNKQKQWIQVDFKN